MSRHASSSAAAHLSIRWIAALLVSTIVVYLVFRTVESQKDLAMSSLFNGSPLIEVSIAAQPQGWRLADDPTAEQPDVLSCASSEETPVIPIRHEGYVGLREGVMFTPDSFSPTDSDYDLLIHFHGNPLVVRESAEVAGLNAVVAVVNLGIGSGAYEQAFSPTGAYEALLNEVERALPQRGLQNPKLRRVALSAWSAGYGAISYILQRRRGSDPLDALLVLDGIHTGFCKGQPKTLNTLNLIPFVRAAKTAADDQILFVITHSEIDPIAYAGTTVTANYLLEQASGHPVQRHPVEGGAAHLRLQSAKGAVAKRLEKPMIPTTEAQVGHLMVRGYHGATREDHKAHLLQMGAIALPELAARWGVPRQSSTCRTPRGIQAVHAPSNSRLRDRGMGTVRIGDGPA